jgi:HK97 family phage prohead protease
VDELNRARTTEESGSGGGKTAHVASGPHGGEFTSSPGSSKTTPKPPAKKTAPKSSQDYKPIVPVKAKTGPMKLGGDNDPQQVKQLQALLGALGLGSPPTNGSFDQATKDAVMEAQRRLGINPTGRASSALLRKLTDSYALSPCVKRSADSEREFEIFRAAVERGQFDDEDEEMSVDVVRSEILRYERTWALEDITIQRGGNGRTVEAYAAIWDTPAEVRDQHGHYMEIISRGAFDKTIKERGDKPIPVYFNHGMTAAGTPSDAYSVPIGRSLEVRAEGRGLWTLSRYNDGPDSDRVLDAIRNGAITAQSFRGKVYKSTKGTIVRGQLPTITRTELGLAEYGPTASAVYEGAAILALRSQAALATLLTQGYDLDQLIELARTSTTPQEPETEATSDQEAGTDEPPAVGEALRSAEELLSLQATAAAILIRSTRK